MVRLVVLEQEGTIPAAMFSRIKSLLQPAAPRYISFVPLCHVDPAETRSWHRCPALFLTDEGYERLHEFLQTNLEGRWSLMPQERDHLDRYDVLVEVETEAGLIDLFRVTMGMEKEAVEDG